MTVVRRYLHSRSPCQSRCDGAEAPRTSGTRVRRFGFEPSYLHGHSALPVRVLVIQAAKRLLTVSDSDSGQGSAHLLGHVPSQFLRHHIPTHGPVGSLTSEQAVSTPWSGGCVG